MGALSCKSDHTRPCTGLIKGLPLPSENSRVLGKHQKRFPDGRASQAHPHRDPALPSAHPEPGLPLPDGPGGEPGRPLATHRGEARPAPRLARTTHQRGRCEASHCSTRNGTGLVSSKSNIQVVFKTKDAAPSGSTEHGHCFMKTTAPWGPQHLCRTT